MFSNELLNPLNPQSAPQDVIKSKDMKYILSHVGQESLLILDIDDTIGRVSQTLGLDSWFRFRIAQYISEGHADSQALEKAIVIYNLAQLASKKMIRVEKECDIAHLIHELKKKGVQVIGLTARNYELQEKTLELLQTIGVSFSSGVLKDGSYVFHNLKVTIQNGCVFANGTHKGRCLEELIRKGHLIHPIDSFKSVHFVDDGEKNCQAVQESFKRLPLRSRFIWHYHYAQTHLVFDEQHKKRAKIQEMHLLEHQLLLTDEEADTLHAMHHLERFGAVGRRLCDVILRLDAGQKSRWNIYMINSGVKLRRIVDAVNAIAQGDSLEAHLSDPQSALYQALNMQRLMPITFFAGLRWNDARSLMHVSQQSKVF